MQLRTLIVLVMVFGLSGSAQAAVKLYDSSPDNGIPSDAFLNRQDGMGGTESVYTIGSGDGVYYELSDDGLGTVTLQQYYGFGRTIADLTNNELIPIFGPGAFIFIDTGRTTTIQFPHVSNTTGIGAHGPSGTDPGESTEWGVVSGWVATGYAFCIASPTAVCTNAEYAHGQTVTVSIESPTYDLGTWAFDAVGDFTGSPYILRTTSGGLTNNGNVPRGALHGSSLPALPIVGFGALAVGLVVMGARSMGARK
jgi:hypothetical protein